LEKINANPDADPKGLLTVAEAEALRKVKEADERATQPESDIGFGLSTQGAGKGGRAYQYDAVSELSSFNAGGEGKAGTDTGVSGKLGKLFATGVAAQNISDGIRHDMAKAWAPNAAECLQKLKEAMGEGKVDAATATAVCGSKS
jgi:hypothetical protein